MPATLETPLTGLFDQAARSFGEALQAGVKAQEQLVGYWTDAVGKASPVADYQEKARAAFTGSLPVAQKSTEEYLRLVDANYRKGIEALKKACDGGCGTTPAEFQAKTRALFEAAVELVKENTQAMAQTNQRVFEAWAEVLRQNGVGAGAGPVGTGPRANPTVK